jgi:hypothetical protein
MKRNTRKFGLALTALTLVVLLLSVFGAVSVWAATINVPTEYPTIQGAINAAGVGDTIQVAAGTYSESNITINKSLTILGAPGDSAPGPAAGAPIIDGGGVVADAFDLADGVSNVTISGFEIRNFGTSDWTNGSGVGIQAWVPSTFNITVSDNWFHDVGYGVMAGNDGSSAKYALGTHTNWTVSGNIIEEFSSIGVELTDTSNSSVHGNVIHMAGGSATGQIGIFSWVHISQSGLTVSGNTIDGAMVNYPAVYMYAYDDVSPSPNLNDVTIENNTISTTGSPFQVYLRDIGTGTVTGVHVNYNSLTGLNSLKNLTAVSIDATANWWGTTDVATIASQISGSGSVDYSPWWGANYVGAAHPWTWYTNDSIQEAIDAASADDTINVAAGTYTERIVIDKPLMLLGATNTINKNGYTVPANYAWDINVESVINYPDPTGLAQNLSQLVDVLSSNVTFKGFVVQVLNARGGFNGDNLFRVNAGIAGTGTLNNIVVENNVLGPATNVTIQNGTYGRMNLYLASPTYSAHYQGITNSRFAGNKIFGAEGNGNNVFIWGAAESYSSQQNADYTGTVIEDNEIYGSHRSGIEIAGGVSNLTIRNNTIRNNSSTNGGASDTNLKYGNGILVIRMGSDKTSITALGADSLIIENNRIYDNEKNAIYLGPINNNYTITGNDIHDNGWDGIRVDLTEQYHGGSAPVYDKTSGIVANFNNIESSGEYGCQVVGTPTNSFVLDATRNYWGSPTGPCRQLPNGKWVGKGDKVSGNVDYIPRLPHRF